MAPPLHAFYSDCFVLPLPPEHRFPILKYRRLRERLQQLVPPERIVFALPPAATDDQLTLAHTPDYVCKVTAGNLSALEQKRIGFPWSLEMVERSRRSTGATLQAARQALKHGVAVNLAGGTHHAFANRGQGYCVFNDVAVTIRTLQQQRLIQQAVVIDLDVHQGNGTASIFQHDPTVFTFSMHGARNYPFEKCDGDLDIPLPDSTDDSSYLEQLQNALHQHLPLEQCDLVCYLAGADPYQHDRLGRLKLTKSGLRQRDELVFSTCAQKNIPVVTSMAGGYAPQLEDIVDIHANTVLTAMTLLHD